MKYAFWPGCVSKGACPELYDSMIKTSAKLGIELEELYDGNCTGAGVISEHEPELADALNARNFALAQKMGLTTLINICSTCSFFPFLFSICIFINGFTTNIRPVIARTYNRNRRSEYKRKCRINNMIQFQISPNNS